MNGAERRILFLTCLIILHLHYDTCGQQPGTKLWQFRTDADVRTPAEIGPDGSIYVTSGAKTYALGPNGQFKWQLDGDSVPPVVGSDGTIYLVTGRRFYSIAPDGTLLWRFSVDDPLEFSGSPALAEDGTIYLASEGEKKPRFDPDDPSGSKRAERLGRLYSVRPGGQGNWRLNFDTLIAFAPVVALDSSPVVGIGSEKIVSYSTSAVHQWSYELSDDAVITPAIGPDGTIYVSDNDKVFYAIGPNGKVKWTFRTGAWLLSSPAVGPDGTIYFGCDNHRLYALNPDGSKKWEFVANAGIRSSPAVAADRTIYFGCTDRNLYALNDLGKLLWTFTTGGPILASPTIDADGNVLIGSDDDLLHAIKGTSPLARSSWPKFRGGLRQSGRPFEMGHPLPETPEPLENPRLSVSVDPDTGSVEIRLVAGAGRAYQFEASSDLVQWIPLSSRSSAYPLKLSISRATLSSLSFFRARVLP